jgi:hypothetical protein
MLFISVRSKYISENPRRYWYIQPFIEESEIYFVESYLVCAVDPLDGCRA